MRSITVSFWEIVPKRAMTRLALWTLSLFRLHDSAPQTLGGSAQIQTIVAESGDLRSLCSNLVQLFGQLVHAERAEIEIYADPPVEGFTVVWTGPNKRVEKLSKQSISIPFAIAGRRLGVLRLQRRSNLSTLAESRNVTALAVEAARHIQTGMHTAKAIEAAVKAERSRLAAQIHHGVAQYVTNALMHLQLCQRSIAHKPARAEEFIHNSLSCAQLAMDAIRATIYSLQYAEKDAPAIATLLRATTERLRSTSSAEFHLDLSPVGHLSPTIEMGLASIAGEALTNAAKHAGARHIYVHLKREDDTIILEVSDDGSGFSYEEGNSTARRWERFGLTLMRDQVHRLGGSIQLHSVPSKGTQVRVLIPTSLRRSNPTQIPEGGLEHQSEQSEMTQ